MSIESTKKSMSEEHRTKGNDKMKISNPVLPGFNPDPSIIRVDHTYYIANSTFEWFPGVRLHASTDMIHWKLLPSPLSTKKLLDLTGIAPSNGVWAPDLSYADGKFWLIFTVVKNRNGPVNDVKNYLTTSTSITGPWSDPLFLNGVGFDSSLFHDNDGKKYLVQQTWDHRDGHHTFNGITLTKFNDTFTGLLSHTARTIFKGTDVRLVEGPHLYKVQGKYYLFTAQGGTSFEHQEIVSRSDTLNECSFEIEPDGPFITNIDTPDFYLQKQGHGALVRTPHNEWYYASLSSRPWHQPTESKYDPRGWSTLGRETSIQKVYWDKDNWPRIVGGHWGQVYVDAPSDAIPMKGSSSNHSRYDDFSTQKLNNEWNTLRKPFTEDKGFIENDQLKLVGQDSLGSSYDVSLLAQRWQSFDFVAETKIKFDPVNYQQMAGLVNFYNDKHWSWIFITFDESKGRIISVAENINKKYTSYLKENPISIPADQEYVWFRAKIAKKTYTYEYSFNGDVWFSTGITLNAAVLSDDFIHKTYGGFFTGAFVGLAAVDYSGYKKIATFDYFNYKETNQKRKE